ncbi:MAG: hypothetical protein JF887_12010 [Candidatus Dormibacteraeota bacterium]|uniref:Uncharacterized protein n=1 Tax=Candidatus Amunia macphersoniae TaxID=3127014 RepID=A0A934KF45_9BACT|nr:hypothetical protein [Candidatus Dormibacteraeota bacterium]
MGLLDSIRALRLRRPARAADALPDPAQPPSNRGEWDHAALTNVEITELVKRQIHTVTRPWQK